MELLFSLLRADAEELQRRFARASITGKGTPQEVADFREHAVQDIVRRYFPFPYRVGKGNIRDSAGRSSDSIDCVLCNPSQPYMVDPQGKFELLLAEVVDAAIEVKPNIADRAELVRGLNQGRSVKSLRRAQSGRVTVFDDQDPNSYARRVPFFLFAMTCKADPLDTGREIVQFYVDEGVPALDQADVVVVNNVGVFVNVHAPELFPWDGTDIPPPERSGWFFSKWNELSMVGFLMHLHLVPHARIKMQDDLLMPYLRQAKFEGLFPLKPSPNTSS